MILEVEEVLIKLKGICEVINAVLSTEGLNVLSTGRYQIQDKMDILVTFSQ